MRLETVTGVFRKRDTHTGVKGEESCGCQHNLNPGEITRVEIN